MPVSHSVNFYNRIVGEQKYGTDALDRIYKNLDSDAMLLGRHIHLSRSYGLTSLIIFEGEHEQLPGALALVAHGG